MSLIVAEMAEGRTLDRVFDREPDPGHAGEGTGLKYPSIKLPLGLVSSPPYKGQAPSDGMMADATGQRP